MTGTRSRAAGGDRRGTRDQLEPLAGHDGARMTGGGLLGDPFLRLVRS